MCAMSEIRYHFWMQQALKESGLSLAEVARRTGFDYSNLWRILKGKAVGDGAQRPTFETAEAIGKVLGDLDGSLKAAGYSTDGDGSGASVKIIRSFDPDDPRVRFLDAADDLSLEYIESIAQQAEVAAREFRKLNPRTGTFGKRARDDEE